MLYEKTVDQLVKLASKQPARNEPDNPGLWSQAISEAKKRFTVYPSAYANGWAAKWYKERGGGWHKEKQAAANTYKSRDGETYVKVRIPVNPKSGFSGERVWARLDRGDRNKGSGVLDSAPRLSRHRIGSKVTWSDGTVKQANIAKKDVGHGGLDEWFSGHGKDKGRAQWGDWVSISPVRKQLQSGRVVEPGDIVGQCGISDSPDWRQYTKGGQDPLKCMPRKKALAMSKEQRAALARGKARAERSSGNTGKPVMTRTFGKLAARFLGSPPNLQDDLPQESGYSYVPPPSASVLAPAAQKILEHRTKLVEMGRPTSINPQQFLRAKYQGVPGGAEKVVSQANAAGSPITWGNLNRQVPIRQAPSGFGAQSGSVEAEYSFNPYVPGVPEAITYEYLDRARNPDTLEHEVNHAINMNLGDSPNPLRPALPMRARPKSMDKGWYRHEIEYPEAQAEYFSRAKGGIANTRKFVPYSRQQAKTELAQFAGQPPYTPVQGPNMTMQDQRRPNFLSASPLWGEGEGSKSRPPFLDMLKRYPGLFTRTL